MVRPIVLLIGGVSILPALRKPRRISYSGKRLANSRLGSSSGVHANRKHGALRVSLRAERRGRCCLRVIGR
jgi:hypothetical protein